MLIVSQSDIDGNGLFTDKPIPSGKLIGEIFQIHIRRWVNHSRNPNTTIVVHRGKLALKATRNIGKNEEITVDYRHPLNPWKGQYDFKL